MTEDVKACLARIGRAGGLRSRRTLTPETARAMVRVREARRAYQRFYAQCFRSLDPALVIRASDVPWVAAQLRKHGGHEAWALADKLCP